MSSIDFEVDSKRLVDYFNKGRGDVMSPNLDPLLLVVSNSAVPI